MTTTTPTSEPKLYHPRSDAEILSDETVIAMPLSPPETFEVQYLRPGIRCRWVNFKATGGSHYDRMCAAGYTVATPQDVKTICTANKEGRFIVGDLLLMKIEESKYAAAIKANVLRAKLATGQRLEEATKELNELAFRHTKGQPGVPTIRPFTPTEKELEAAVGANQAVGRVIQSTSK